jgi:hypothetical protein
MTMVATPATASAVPTNACSVGERLLKNAQSSSNTSTGMAVTINAAMPEGMPCCAQVTRPLPIPDSNTPTSAAIGRFTCASGFGPRQRNHRYMAPPATRKRTPPLMNGGMVSITSAMPRYVVPQTK